MLHCNHFDNSLKVMCEHIYIYIYIYFKLLHDVLFHTFKKSFAAAAAAAKLLQSCPTVCDPIDGSPPGSPIPGTLQARTLEWVAISFSNAWKWKVKVKSLSRPHGLQPTRLLHPWDFPGKSSGVGCHCLLRKSLLGSCYYFFFMIISIKIFMMTNIAPPSGQSFLFQKRKCFHFYVGMVAGCRGVKGLFWSRDTQWFLFQKKKEEKCFDLCVGVVAGCSGVRGLFWSGHTHSEVDHESDLVTTGLRLSRAVHSKPSHRMRARMAAPEFLQRGPWEFS